MESGFFCIKADPFNALCASPHPFHNAVNGNRRVVEIWCIITKRRLGSFFPLSAGNSRMMGVLPACVSFFIANIASIGHNINFQITNTNFQKIKNFNAPEGALLKI